MPPDRHANEPGARHEGWATLRRFVPYLWPRDNPRLRWRIVVSVLLIGLSIIICVPEISLTLPRLAGLIR